MTTSTAGWESQIADYLNAHIEGLQTCRRYNGQFDANPVIVKRLACPAVFVSATGWEKSRTQPGDGRIALRVGFTAHILTEKAPDSAPDDSAVNLALAVTNTVDGARLGISDAQVASLHQASRCPTAPLNKKELIRWSVSWHQVIYLGKSLWPELEPAPLDLRFSHVPEVGFGHEQDYHRMAEDMSDV